jgi:trimethyllysine dioxygenase
VTWNDGHKSQYSKAWLAASGEKHSSRSAERQGMVDMELWAGKDIKQAPPTVEYDTVMKTDDGLKDWLHTIRKYGFCYVENTPVTPEATEKLLERISFIRPTHYGGFYDFTADLAKGDTAYTQLGIGAHTDNTYFSDPAGLQVFHLLSHPDGEGGASQLVDGFAAARQLQKEDRDAYQLLGRARIHAHASGNEDSSIQPYQAFPTLVHDPQGGQLVQVRWNTTDRAAIDLPMEDMQSWYNAAR